MRMTEGEICREYRMAKDKNKQIGIIADQCGPGIDREEIIKVLVDCGEMEPPEKPAGRIRKKQEKVTIPKSAADALTRRIDELEAQIKQMEEQIAPLSKEYEELAGFLKNCAEVV